MTTPKDHTATQGEREREAFNRAYITIAGRELTIREIAWRCWQARAALAQRQSAPADPQAPSQEDGQLHPDVARSTARAALGYSAAFDGKGINWHSAEPWPHRIELAQALGWITDLGAMVLNLADRVESQPPSQEAREALPNVHALRKAACDEWGANTGGPDEYELFASKLWEAFNASRIESWPMLVGYSSAIRAIRAIVADPYGCPFCDSGKLRGSKPHDENCGFALAEKALRCNHNRWVLVPPDAALAAPPQGASSPLPADVALLSAWVERETAHAKRCNFEGPSLEIQAVARLLAIDADRKARQQEALTDEQCSAIYDALDEWARGVDSYEYGLPMFGKDKGRELIRAAIAKGERHE